MIVIKIFITMICIFISNNLFALESEKEIISLNRTYLAIGDKSTPVKLELGFKHKLIDHSEFYIGYHQKSLWDINNGSSPVLDSNYNPHIYYNLGNYYNINWTLGILEHLSNGGSGERSRGTNMSFIHGYKEFSHLDIGLKAFASYKKDNGSPDINEYMGTWALMLRFKNIIPFIGNYHAFEIRSNAGGKYGTKLSNGSNEFSIYYRPTVNANFNIYAQYFTGRNEYLLDYKTYHNKSRVGILLSY